MIIFQRVATFDGPPQEVAPWALEVTGAVNLLLGIDDAQSVRCDCCGDDGNADSACRRVRAREALPTAHGHEHLGVFDGKRALVHAANDTQ
jgi:hypothetical protein